MLAAGKELAEQVVFGGGATLSYCLANTADSAKGTALFDGQTIRVSAPLSAWTKSEEIGFYFEVEPGLKVAIEKDLECLDGPAEEKDPHAFPRADKTC